MTRRQRSDILRPLLTTLVSVGLSYAISLVLRRRKQADSCSALANQGTVPHTDFDAAAKIGRQTGGEIFDD